jgi:hypothetical protein
MALAGRPAQADVVYTWHETDRQNVTGSLSVGFAALANGQITLNDVTAFSFSVPMTTYVRADLVGQSFVFPAITIDKTTGAFTSTVAAAIQAMHAANNDRIVVTTTASSMMMNGNGNWADTLNNPATGTGFWTVTVPEPSTLVLGVIAACGLAPVLYQRHKRQRQTSERVSSAGA